MSFRKIITSFLMFGISCGLLMAFITSFAQIIERAKHYFLDSPIPAKSSKANIQKNKSSSSCFVIKQK